MLTDKIMLDSESMLTDKIINIATDGSFRKSRKTGSSAWAGGYIAQTNPPRQRVEGGYGGTNNIGELTAIKMAIEDFPDVDLRIYSDSEYSIKAIDFWSQKWVKNGWKTALGDPVKNQEIIKEILGLKVARTQKGLMTSLEWVRGHNGHELNEQIDTLVAGFTAELMKTDSHV